MAEDLISSFISEKGKQELQQAINSLKEMLVAIKEINSNQIKVEGKTSGSSSVLELKNNIDSLNKTQAEFSRTLQEIKKQEDALSQTQAKLNASYYDEAKALAQAKVELQARNREMTNAAKAAMISGNAYDRMNVLHQKLIKHAQRLGAAFGTESKQFEVAANRANNLGKRLVEIDAQLGNHRRNVGNYASGWSELNHQTGMLLRELPNLGISLNTFVLSLSNNLPYFFDAIKSTNEQNKILIDQGKQTVPVFKQILSSIINWQTAMIVGVTLLTRYGNEIYKYFTEGSAAFQKAKEEADAYSKSLQDIANNSMDFANKGISSMQLLIEIAQDETQATIAREKAVKELQETYPTTFGQLDKHRILEGNLKDAINETTKALIAKSMAMSADKSFQEAGERVYKLTKEYEAQEKVVDRYYGMIQQAMKDGTLTTVAGPYGMSYEQVIQKNIGNQTKLLKDIENRLLSAQKDRLDFLNDYKRFSREAAALLTDDDSPDTTGNGGSGSTYDPFGDELKARKEYLEELAKLDQQRQRQAMEEDRMIYENEKGTLEERLDAYRSYAFSRSLIAQAGINAELEDTRSKLEDIDELENRSNKTYTKQENDLLLDKEMLMIREKRLREQLQAEITAINRQGLKDVSGIIKSEFNEFKSLNDQRVADSFAAMEEETSELKRQLDNRKITHRQFRAQLRNIQSKQAIEAVDIAIKAVDEEMEANKGNAEYYELLTNYKIQLENQRHKLVVKNKGTEAQMDNEDLQRTIKNIQTIYNAFSQVSSEIRGMISDRYRAEQEEFNRQLEQIEERKNKEIEAINAMALSDEERINRVSAAEAKAAVEKAIIEKKERQSRMRQAQFEKQAAITEIILKTSIAVMEAWSTGNYIAAASAGAVGAAQLARAMAAPIPQYATGVDSSPEGLAIVGEKGRELKITPDGDVSLTPGQATLDYLKKGTTIIPADKTDKIIREMGLYGTPVIPVRQKQPSNIDVINALKDQTRSLTKALNRQKKPAGTPDRINWSLYVNQKTKGIC